jgi:hypothetical protein
MKKNEFLKSEVLTRLGEKLKSSGYKLSKSACEFTKKTDFGWNKYQIVFLNRDNGWELKPSLLVRFNEVENLFHQISDFDKKYQKVTPTIGTSIEDLVNSSITQTRLELTNEIQINGVVNSLIELFDNVADPFFRTYNNLHAIDEKLNSNVNDTSLTGDIFKGIKSLIIAKLIKRKDFCKIENIYHSYYKEFSNGFYLPEYLKLRELLKSNV